MLLIDFSKWKIILSVGVLFSIIIITFASLNPNNPVSKKITGRIEENQAISINTLSSYRPILMKTAIDNVSESITSLIFGLGVKKAGEKSEAKLGHPYSAHNKFIDILQYSGAIGLLLYILYLLHVLILIFKTRNKSKEYSLLLTFSILAFLYLIPSHGLTIYSNLLFGALIAYNILLKESESDEKLIL